MRGPRDVSLLEVHTLHTLNPIVVAIGRWKFIRLGFCHYEA